MKFKIVLCGDKAVGKTSYLKRIIYKQFSIKYTPSSSLVIHNLKSPLSLSSSSSNNFEIDFWDMPSSAYSLKDAYIIKANMVILMFDLTDDNTYESLYDWYKDIQNIDPKIPIIVLANKSESSSKQLDKLDFNFHNKYNLKLFEISCKTNKNVEASLNYIFNYFINKIEN